jgi:uroporphyrinogen decarboxylase
MHQPYRPGELNMIETCIKPDPDFGRLDMVLRRQGTPDRVPFFELFSDIQSEVLQAIGKGIPEPQKGADDLEQEAYLRQCHFVYMFHMGYDYVNAGARNFGFPTKPRPKTMTDQGERGYIQGASCTIANRQDFEEYAWPVMSNIDYTPLETVKDTLPEGMKVIASGSGVLENVMWLLGYEGISLMLYDDLELVADMFEAVGSRILKHFETLASFEEVGALCLGEDMGFNTQTFLAPDLYHRYLFPWHSKLVEAAHRQNKPIILHSCGNLSAVMDDIIACGWDAKHSYEENIEPVWEAKQRYGDRIAIMGGFDMDRIVRASVEEVRVHTRELMQRCATGGGWALGTGNSVANYIPTENFIAMLDEGYRIGRY